MLEFSARLCAEVDLRPSSLRELVVAGYEIRMQMCLDDVPDLDASLSGRCQVDVDVALRIDDRSDPFASDQVGSVGETRKVKLFEDEQDAPPFVLLLVG
jgi:hypothetical protein